MEQLILTKVHNTHNLKSTEIIKLLINPGCYTGPRVVDTLIEQGRIKEIGIFIQHGCAVSDNVIYHVIKSTDYDLVALVAKATKHRSTQVLEYLITTNDIHKSSKYYKVEILLEAGFPTPLLFDECFKISRYPELLREIMSEHVLNL